MRGLFNTLPSLLKQRKLKYHPRRRPKKMREHTGGADFFRHVSTLRVDLERRRNIHCKPDEEGNKDQDKEQDEDKDEDDEEDSV